MNLKQILRIVISLIGFHSVFTAIVVSGLSMILVPYTFFKFGTDRIEATGYSALIVTFQFFAPFLFGMFLLVKNRLISEWILRLSDAEGDLDLPRVSVGWLSATAFSLLGLYMLASSIPALCAFIAFGFQTKIPEASAYGQVSSSFLRDNFDHVIFHGVAVGFSFFVFMKGKSLSRFVHSLRKGGQQIDDGNIVKPSGDERTP